jgi:tetratricopeptide (TPR) repeat protein
MSTSKSQQAYNEALAFLPSRANALAISPAQATTFAEQEATFQTIAIDENGMSSGMRLNLLQPVHDLASEWRALWNSFEVAIQPKMTDINAVQKLHAEAAEEIRKRDEALEAIERELRQSSKYEEIDDHHSRSMGLFNAFRDKHSNRNAVMFARSPLYGFLLFLVLLTECFINYNAFNTFWGVPAVAFGSTVVLGVLLALSSHGYGEILKQWSFRFGRDRDPGKRWTDWRMFGMSTAGLIVVLAFTGWARWAAAIDLIGSQSQASALGSIGVVQVDPLRDVLVSLIANFGAWMVGVIISYLAHDPDPEYMAATKQFRAARKAYNRARDAQKVLREHIEARAAKKIEEKTRAAETRQKAVTHEMDMLKQVTSRGDAVQLELEQVTTRNVETYRDALVRVALARQGQVQIVRAGTNTPFSPFDYKQMRIAPPQLLTQTAA